jgi:signal transduction histidine kinase
VSLSSVRARLTLWNVGVLALVLLLLGLVLRYAVQRNLLAAVDRDLVARSRPLLVRWVAGLPGAQSGEPAATGLRREERIIINRRGRAVDRKPFSLPLDPAFPAAGRDPLPPRLLTLERRDVLTRAPAAAWDARAFDAAARGGETVYSTVVVDGAPVRVFSAPLRSRANGPVDGVVQVAYPLGAIHREIGRLTGTLLALAPIALLAAGVGGAFLTSRALRPVRDLTQAAGRIGAENLSERVPISGNDEFAALGATVNGMLARLDDAFTRLEASVEQQKRFTADASHELRSPLTVIKAHTSLALQDPHATTPDELWQTIAAVDRAADRTTRLVENLLLLARADAGRLGHERAPVRVNSVFQQAIEAVHRSQPASAPIHVSVDDPPLFVNGNETELVRLLNNLLENALCHTPPDGQIRLATRQSDTGDQIAVTVSDTGEGIAAEHLPHVCERFYRADAARTRASGGTGLGLSICDHIVRAHNGALALESVVGKGTTVRVTLPRWSPTKEF